MRWFSVLSLSLLACSFSGATPPGTSIDAGADVADAADPDAGASADNCGKSAAYVEDFDGAGVDESWFLVRGGDVSFNGTITINPTSNAEVSGIISKHLIDLRDDHITIEVTQHFDPGSDRGATFSLAAEAGTNFGFRISRYFITADVTIDDGGVFSQSIPIDRIAHRFLRLREQSGTLFFETSETGDEGSFVELANTTSPRFAAAGRVQVLAIDGGGNNDPISFDGLNAGRDKVGWCRASSLVDSFDNNDLSPFWLSLDADPNCTGNVETTQLDMTVEPIASTNGVTCSVRTAAGFDLREDAVAIEVPAITDSEIVRFLAVYDLVGAFFGVSHRSTGELCSYSFSSAGVEDASFVECISYASTHNYWRIGASGADVFIEVSADQAAWTEVARKPSPFALDAIDIEFGGFVFGSSNGGVFTVTGYNEP